MSYLNVLIAVLSSLGAGGIASLVVMFVRERRLSLVTKRCLDAKTKAEKEHTLEVLRTLQGTGEQPQVRRLPRPRARSSGTRATRQKDLASTPGSTPSESSI